MFLVGNMWIRLFHSLHKLLRLEIITLNSDFHFNKRSANLNLKQLKKLKQIINTFLIVLGILVYNYTEIL